MGMTTEENKITIRLDEETFGHYSYDINFMGYFIEVMRSEIIRIYEHDGYIFIRDILRYLDININTFAYSDVHNKGYYHSYGPEYCLKHGSFPKIEIHLRCDDIGNDGFKDYIYVTISDFIELEVRPKVKENE